jgi:hypothetical protein
MTRIARIILELNKLKQRKTPQSQSEKGGLRKDATANPEMVSLFSVWRLCAPILLGLRAFWEAIAERRFFSDVSVALITNNATRLRGEKWQNRSALLC